MKLSNVLRKECILPIIPKCDKTSVLKKIAHLAKQSPILQDIDEQELLNRLKEREKLCSTGIGRNIAIPHCRLPNIDEFVVGIITAPEGIDFEAIDGEKVTLFVFIISPEKKTNEHIKLLSAISQSLGKPDVIENIINQSDPEQIFNHFLQAFPEPKKESKIVTPGLIHIFLQKDDLFEEILQCLSDLEAHAILTVEAKDISEHLTHTPLFAELMTGIPHIFCRIIIVAIDKPLINETIRRIEQITGNIEERDDILVTIQDLTYMVGSLNRVL